MSKVLTDPESKPLYTTSQKIGYNEAKVKKSTHICPHIWKQLTRNKCRKSIQARDSPPPLVSTCMKAYSGLVQTEHPNPSLQNQYIILAVQCISSP